jgi:hypothetical protein
VTPGFHALWPTPLGVFHYADASEMNPLLARMFGALRSTELHAGDVASSSFFASGDDLLDRIRLPEWQGFIRFIIDSVQNTVAHANAGVWPSGRLQLRLQITGMWFQVSNHGAFHDVHNHGNCSWSGVYYVQLDPVEQRRRHPVYGVCNGATRFYGPYLGRLGGAYADLGNAYLQRPHCDVIPEEGMLVVFPSFLEHKALPYEGERDRVSVSFNAGVHAADGNDKLFAYAAS